MILLETLFVVLPDGSGHYEVEPVSYDDFPEGTRFYLSESNAKNHPELDLGNLVFGQ